MRYSKYFLCLFFLGLLSCQSAETASRRTSSDKLTRQEDPDGQLHIGVDVTVNAPPGDPRIEIMSHAFDQQMGVFEPCRTVTKDGLFIVGAQWIISKNGRFTVKKITKLVPNTKAMTDCFFSQIKQLAFKPMASAASGSLVLETYYGSKKRPSDDSGRQE